MYNNRPIKNPKLQRALNEFKRTMEKHGLAGACVLISKDEAAFAYGMHAPWSAISPDPDTPMGFRLRASTRQGPPELAKARVEGAVHTICQMADFGEQTTFWMNDLKEMVRRAGIDWDHIPHGGQPLPHLTETPPPNTRTH